MTGEEKTAFANEVEKAIFHPMVEEAIDELLFNLNRPGDGLVRYGLRKVANVVGHLARADALGIDPSDLVMTDEESQEAMLKMAANAAEDGVPVIVVETP